MSYNDDWVRVDAGHYTTKDQKWSVHRWGKGQWWVFDGDRLWGRWKSTRGWRRYTPFKTFRMAARAVAELDRGTSFSPSRPIRHSETPRIPATRSKC